MTKTAPAIVSALRSVAAFAGYLQHVPGDVADSRQNFPLRVARGEVVDLSIDFFNDGEPLDINGADVTLHTRTNGMDAAESWQTVGTATNNSALFVLDVDAVLPLAAGQWSCVASRDGRTLARVGGPAYVRGTAAAQSAALPQNALSGYATTNYVNAAIGAIDVDETDPAWSAWVDANTNRFGYVSHVEEAETALSAEYAGQAGSAIEAQTAGTATYADTSAFATNAADAQHAWNAETASTLLVGFAARDGEFFTECDGAVAQAATNYTDSAITAATNALQDTALAGKLDNTGLHNNNGTLRAVSFNTDGLFIFNGEVWLDVPATSGAALTAGDLENPDSYLYQMFDEKASKSETATAVSNIVTKAYVENLGIESGIQEETDPTVPQWAKAQTKPTYTAGEVGATTPADVTAAIRDLSLGGIWDEQIQVWWTPRMRNGSLTYEATTNVNLNAED